VQINIEDAVAYMARRPQPFDVILIDSTDPMGPGEGLFTEAFYQDVLASLTEHGIMAAQSESPISDQREMRMMYALLRKVFPLVTTYVAPLPTYPGGMWSWAFCSNGITPFEQLRLDAAADLEKTTRYYNQQVHTALFALPNFVRELTGAAQPVPC
jgi:spermidine synthase